MSTLSELRLRARRRVDAVENNFFHDDEITEYINIGLGELHDLLITQYEDYYVSSASFSLVADQDTYSFISDIGIDDFYKLLGVDATSGSDTMRVRRFSFPERNKYTADTAVYNSNGYAAYEYSLRNSGMVFTPAPTSTDTIKIWYVPKFKKLVDTSDEVEDSVMSNWEEYAVLSAAIKMRQKEETAVGTLQDSMDRLQQRILDAAKNRDAAEPMGITDENTGILPYHRWVL